MFEVTKLGLRGLIVTWVGAVRACDSPPAGACSGVRMPELSPGPSRPRGAKRAWLSPRPGAFDVTAPCNGGSLRGFGGFRIKIGSEMRFSLI